MFRNIFLLEFRAFPKRGRVDQNSNFLGTFVGVKYRPREKFLGGVQKTGAGVNAILAMS